MHDALLQTPEGDRIRCGLCPHRCLVAEGAVGSCGARGVVEGRLTAQTYGMVSSMAADPIEKKPVFHFRPGTKVFSLGGVGCTMRCGHCQNWEISRPAGDDGSLALRYVGPEAVPGLAVQSGCEGVAFTYNEPVIWLEYVLDVARHAHEQGLYTVMVTNSYVTPEGLDLFAEQIDVWRADIKGYEESTYRTLCHVGHAEAVRAATQRAKVVHDLHVECVTNIVPGINDSSMELRSVAHWIATSLGADTPWHVTRFVPYLEFAHLEPTPLATLLRAAEIGAEEGLNFVYVGNIDSPGGEDTICPHCGVTAVSRSRFSVRASHLTQDGRCSACGGDLNVKGATDGDST